MTSRILALLSRIRVWYHRHNQSSYWAVLTTSVLAGLVMCGALFSGLHYIVPLSVWQLTPHMPTYYLAIPYGSTTLTIAKELEENAVIGSAFWFRFYARLFGYDKHLKAGYFQVDGTMTLRQILHKLGRKNIPGSLIRVTFPEGSSLHQMASILHNSHLIQRQEFVAFVRHAKPIFVSHYSFLEACPTENLEGFLFPDTYFFAKGTDPSMVVNLCLSQFGKKMVAAWQISESPIKDKYSFYQILTLASMIEKEAQAYEEMPLISSVFFNRLSRGMALASDPTVIYALGYTTKPIVTYRDLKVDSPYNTYRYRGLPPTPICSPSYRAFLAALMPRATTYLFFVADGKGRHHFTQTYLQHLAAQNK